MKKKEEKPPLGEMSEPVFKLVTTYVDRHFKALPAEETKPINDSLVEDLLGGAQRPYRPKNVDLYRAAILRSVLEILIHIPYLDHHIEMIKRNPYKTKIPDSDYIAIVAHSFDETCYIVHERLLKLYNLLRRKSLISRRTQAISDLLFKNEKKRGTKEDTIFNAVLSARGTHVHNLNVDRPKVPRLSLLKLFEGQLGNELEGYFKAEYRRQLRLSRAENVERLSQLSKLVRLGAEKFFEAALPNLKALFAVKGSQDGR